MDKTAQILDYYLKYTDSVQSGQATFSGSAPGSIQGFLDPLGINQIN
jgi:hypothetical protein